MTMHTIEAHFEVKASALTSREERIEARAVALMAEATGYEPAFVRSVLRIISVFNDAMQQAVNEVGG